MTEIPFFKDKKQGSLDSLRHCECGICGHRTEEECYDCSCCLNFHQRSSGGIHV